jgi:hypothetical protein
MLQNSSPRGSDRRYKLLKRLIELGEIARYEDIFEYIPKTVIGNDSNFNSTKITKLIKNPREWRVREVIWLSELIGVDSLVLIKLIIEHINSKRKPV